MYSAFGKSTILPVVQILKLNTLNYRNLHVRNIPALHNYHDFNILHRERVSDVMAGDHPLQL